jgi:hypothetical protein
MKDILLDVVQHTYNLGIINLIKIVGTEHETKIITRDDGKHVIITGITKVPLPEFVGTFGMPNLQKLKTILSFDDYDDTSVISMKREMRNEESVPTSLKFETGVGDFVNEYRLMGKTIIEEKMKTMVLDINPKWNVEFVPTINGIQRLKKQSQANSEQSKFTVRTENSDVKIFFGDSSTHSGNFIFHPGCGGHLTKAFSWHVKHVISILDLTGTKTVKISDSGLMSIVVDSGLAVYTYLLPASR